MKFSGDSVVFERCDKITLSPMFSFNLTKFFACFALIFSLFAACAFRSGDAGETDGSSDLALETAKSDLPFVSAEPDIFQAEIVVTAGGAERKTFVARSGAKRRTDYDFGTENRVIVLRGDKNCLIIPAKKIYAEEQAAESAPPDDWTN